MALLTACADKGTDPADSDSSDSPPDTDIEDDTDTPSREDTGPRGVEVPPLVPDVLVDCQGGADFVTITEAIAGSVSGTKIGLNPCTYTENVDYIGKSLNIFGVEGSGVTTILGDGFGPVVKAIHGESLGTRLAGVTVSGGTNPTFAGAGITVDLAVMALEDVVFTGNDDATSVLFGNGAFVESLDVVYTNNAIEPDGGIQIFLNGSSVAQRQTITCTGLAFGIYQHNAMLMLDSELDCGESHGIYNQGNGSHIRRSRVESEGTALIASDADDTRNERVWLFNSAFIGQTAVSTIFMHVKVSNSVFWGEDIGFDLQYAHLDSYLINSIFAGDLCPLETTSSEVYELGWNALTSANAGCNSGGYSAIVGDPALVDPPDDFQLQAGSPLIDAGDPDSDQDDPDGTRNDIGLFGGPEGSGQL